ncbi:MAG: glutamine-hydrolyzing GMP synthase [Anaerolineaceae bacterium]|nr:glutamine-hydrolyzing GMP synthase [Anaerolineaceae bacterium]
MTQNTIAILDYGSQYTQLIARRVRETHVYCELFPWDAPKETVMALEPKGIILSGGPSSVYEENAPTLPDYVLESGLPVLGICYGMQLLTHHLGGVVSVSAEREYGYAVVSVHQPTAILPEGELRVWMSHGDRIEALPPGFRAIAHSPNSPYAMIHCDEKPYYGVQFHPEVNHTEGGAALIERFVKDICKAEADWTPESIIQQAVAQIRAQIGDRRVLSAVSGGVDSSVATALVHKAVGDQLVSIFVDTGMLRMNEREMVETTFRKNMGLNLYVEDGEEAFLTLLRGVTEPEQKRRVIGETFIRIFEVRARELGSPEFLVQGTIYPDVVESAAPDRSKAAKIKSHHNVGGLPEDMKFELVEPLRYLFKDEVRAVGEALGLPAELVWRQPFPGPGLAVRCLGDLTKERLDTLRQADLIFTSELEAAGHMKQRGADGIAQAFAVLLPVRSVGVMGDLRTYEEVIALRAVSTDDFMTADWAYLPHEFLARVANRIVNEVKGVNRVVYDITSKPPGTIEWE